MAVPTKSSTDEFIKGLWKENPVFVQVLGMCPVLAVSNTAINALAMGLATAFVLVMSNIVVSSLRSFIPKQVRIATYILIIATFVTVVDYVIQAVSLDLYKALGAFISLIVVNCLILGRAEAFASKNTVGRSIMDGLGMGIGFAFALFCLGAVREILGAGSLFGAQLFHDSFQDWVVMILPSGGFFTLAGWLLLFNWLEQRKANAEPKGHARAQQGGGVMASESLWTIFINASLVNNFVLAYFLGHLSVPRCVVQARNRDPHGRSGDVRHAGELDLRVRDPGSAGGDRRAVPQAHLVHRRHRVHRATGGDVHQEGQPGALPGARNLPAADHHQLRDPGVGALSNQQGLQLRAMHRLRPWCRGWIHPGLVLMAGLREKLELAEVPDVTKGTAMALMIAGLLSVTFMGFGGLGG